VIALGGDGTTLAALRAAAPRDRPVLGVACGSLGALTAVTADDLEDALDRVAHGHFEQRRLPALAAEQDGEELMALNDLVLVRAGAGQVTIEVQVDGERFIRFAGTAWWARRRSGRARTRSPPAAPCSPRAR